MVVTANTFFGERITIRNRSISEAISTLKENGITEDWIYKLEARLDEAIV